MFVFSVDANKGVQSNFAANPVNYTKSVDNYLGRYIFFQQPLIQHAYSASRLQKEYHLFNEKLGQTGAGLRFEDVKEGSNLSNLIGPFPSHLLLLTLTFFRAIGTRVPILEASPWFLEDTPQLQPVYSIVRAWAESSC